MAAERSEAGSFTGGAAAAEARVGNLGTCLGTCLVGNLLVFFSNMSHNFLSFFSNLNPRCIGHGAVLYLTEVSLGNLSIIAQHRAQCIAGSSSRIN
jgi:hypothetical protein